ncbi:MAG: phosphatase PAP2 family protein [Gemmatimonadaceae bacterium]
MTSAAAHLRPRHSLRLAGILLGVLVTTPAHAQGADSLPSLRMAVGDLVTGGPQVPHRVGDSATSTPRVPEVAHILEVAGARHPFDTLQHIAPSRQEKRRWFFTPRDALLFGALAAGAVLVSPLDETWTPQLQRDYLQDNRLLRNGADVFQVIGNPGSVLSAASIYLAGRLSRSPAWSDAGWHATEAVLLSSASSFALKGLIGRARPLTRENGSAGVFRPGHGFGNDYSSMPSGHTTVAFALASSLSRELQVRHVRGRALAVPLLYTVASLVGVSRLYNDKHWTSDVVAGAALGTFFGVRVVKYTHAVPGSWLNWGR